MSIDEAKEAGSTVLGNRWVYRKKVLVDGSMQWKARLVVKGFMQVAGVDYGDVFSSVAQLKSFRLVVALSVFLGLSLYHVDFDQAFVQSALVVPVYMVHPEGYPGPPNTCLKLFKSLYGLKSAPKMWSELLRSTLVALGFVVCTSDNCILYSRELLCFIVTFSDDIIIACKYLSTEQDIVSSLREGLNSKILARSLAISWHGGILQ